MGLSGQGGSFNQRVIEAVMEIRPTRSYFALSNPTDLTEVLPMTRCIWSDGAATVANSAVRLRRWSGRQRSMKLAKATTLSYSLALAG